MAFVLVVDDDASIRRAYATVLREEGHLVSQARNGIEALDLMRMHLHPMVVVVADVMMPVVGGLDLLEAVTQDPGMHDDYAFLVATSASMHHSPRLAPLCTRANVDLLCKPVDIDALVAAVTEAALRLPRLRYQSDRAAAAQRSRGS